jgi:F0F1-type ATP synthase assembly protein I
MLIVFWALQSLDRGTSSALGALAIVVPNGFFAWRASVPRAADAVSEAQGLMVASVVKLMLGVAMLIAAFTLYRPEPIAFFATLIAVQAVHWLAPLVLKDFPRAAKKNA